MSVSALQSLIEKVTETSGPASARGSILAAIIFARVSASDDNPPPPGAIKTLVVAYARLLDAEVGHIIANANAALQATGLTKDEIESMIRDYYAEEARAMQEAQNAKTH